MDTFENITYNENTALELIVNSSMITTLKQSDDFDIQFNILETNISTLTNDIYDGIPQELESNHSSLENLFGNATTSISERFMDESRHWVQRVLVPFVMCIGVIGNSVSMVVLTRRKMRSSTNSYLTALAISDLLYLIFVFSLSLQHHPDIQHPRHWFYWQYVRYAFWLTDASSSTSIWLTVTFTIERYVVVSHPIKGKVLCTVSRAKKFVVVVYCVCWLLTASTPHEWIVVTKTESPSQTPYLALDYSALGRDPTYRVTYYWFSAVIFILLPLCLLVVFNGFLIQTVRKSKQQRRRMTMVSERDHYSHQQEYKITVMLIAVVLLALLCQMPTAVLLLYSTVYQPPPKTAAYHIMRGLGNIFNLLIAVNAAANFLLYCAFSDKFRRTFLITFFPCFYKQHFISHSFVASNRGETARRRREEEAEATDVEGREGRWRNASNGGRQGRMEDKTNREIGQGRKGVSKADMEGMRREHNAANEKRTLNDAQDDKRQLISSEASLLKRKAHENPGGLPLGLRESPAIITEIFKESTMWDQRQGLMTSQKQLEEIRSDNLPPGTDVHLSCTNHTQDGSTSPVGSGPVLRVSETMNSDSLKADVTYICSTGQETKRNYKNLSNQNEINSLKLENRISTNGTQRAPLALNGPAECSNEDLTNGFRFIDDPLSDESITSVDRI